jgi:hypothetical protein
MYSRESPYSEDLVSFDRQTIDQKDAEGFEVSWVPEFMDLFWIAIIVV